LRAGRVLRAAWWRRDLTAGLGLVVAVATATAVAAPTFAEAASAALVRERVAVDDSVGTDISWAVAAPAGEGGLSTALEAAGGLTEDLSLYESPVRSASALVAWPAVDRSQPAALAWHEDQCDQVAVTGRCPARAGEVLLPAESPVAERFGVGDEIVVHEQPADGVTATGPAHPLTVVGTWQPRDRGGLDTWYALSRWQAAGQIEMYPGCDSAPSPETLTSQSAPLLTDVATLDAIPGRTVFADAALASSGDVDRLRATATAVERWQSEGHAETIGDEVCAAAVSDADIDDVLGPVDDERDRLASQGTGAAAGAVLIGVLAVVLISTTAARRRRHELALAKLRGVRGRRLATLAMNESALLVLVGAVLGVFLGWGVAEVAARAWLGGGVDATVPASTGSLVVLVVGFSLVGVAAGVARTVREPIHLQLRPERPRAASALAIVGRVVVFVAAALGVYQLRRAEVSDPPWWALSLPVLVGLAGGLVAVWLIRWAARLLTALTRQRSGGGPYLAGRRLLRRGDLLAVVPFVVAAIVLMVVAGAAWNAGSQWRESTALLRTGGPVAISSAKDAEATLKATRRADPDGEWLMAAVSVEGDSGGVYRRLFVDTTRWERVLAPELSGSATAIPSDVDPGVLDALRASGLEDPGLANGDRLSVSIDLDVRRAGASSNDLRLELVDPRGTVHIETVRLAPYGRTSLSFPVPYCREACDVQSFAIDPVRGYAVWFNGRITLEELAIGDTDLLTRDWRPANGEAVRFEPTPGGGLSGAARSQPVFSELAAATGSIPIVTAGGLDLTDPEASVEPGTVLGIGGGSLQARAVGDVDSLPIIGDSGLMGDLTTFLDSERFAETVGDSVVIARADTPNAVLESLAASGIDPSERVSTGDARRLLDNDPYAQALRFFWLAAGLVAVIALCAVTTALVSQRPARAQESAALRVAGMRRRQLRAAVVVEVGVVAALVAACGWLAAWLSTWATLSALPLGEPAAFEPAPEAVTAWSSGLVPAVTSSVVVAVVAVGLLLPVSLRSRPAILRGGGD
jgi:putative ABC transport system permease protein